MQDKLIFKSTAEELIVSNNLITLNLASVQHLKNIVMQWKLFLFYEIC